MITENKVRVKVKGVQKVFEENTKIILEHVQHVSGSAWVKSAGQLLQLITLGYTKIYFRTNATHPALHQLREQIAILNGLPGVTIIIETTLEA